MNYIWELAIKALEKSYGQDGVTYKHGLEVSPYMELSFSSLNETDVYPVVEINPFYRFYSVFKELCEPNLGENPEIVGVMFDLATHHLQDIDLNMGMSRREYYIRFIIKDLLDGFWGSFIKEKIDLFTQKELKTLANNLLALHTSGEALHALISTIKSVFPGAYIFLNMTDKDEVAALLRASETPDNVDKINIIKRLFMPVKYAAEIYWERIFGVIGVDEFMVIGETVNY
ncbi:MAG: hypothetical protein LBL35_08520 [Clostridiales bacterium]|jgi:hypothetical protein|nr:hypothetical protein [Clostridiales bacterium]